MIAINFSNDIVVPIIVELLLMSKSLCCPYDIVVLIIVELLLMSKRLRCPYFRSWAKINLLTKHFLMSVQQALFNECAAARLLRNS